MRLSWPEPSLEDLFRFLDRVRPAEPPPWLDRPCWLWTGGASQGGRENPDWGNTVYGSFWFAGQGRRAHVFAAHVFGLEKPPGWHWDHLCERPLCVCPWHLEAVTTQENTARIRTRQKTVAGGLAFCRAGAHVDGTPRERRGPRGETPMTATELKTGPDYVRAYNALAAQLGRPPVKRFGDLKAAQRRYAEISALADGEADEAAASGKRVVSAPAPAPEPPVTHCPPGVAKGVKKPRKVAKTVVKSTKSERKPNGAASPARNVRGFYFKRPLGSAIKDPRAKTKRAKVLELMLRDGGTTHAEVMEVIGWDARTAYEGIRLINIEHGYGIDHDEKSGRVHAYASKNDSWGA